METAAAMQREFRARSDEAFAKVRGWWESGDPVRMLAVVKGRVSDRKLRLFAIACCRIENATTDPAVYDKMEEEGNVWQSNFEWAGYWADGPSEIATREMKAALLRDICGDPFDPVKTCDCGDPLCRSDLKRWLTPTVVGLAQSAYSSRDWAILPVLADALEDSGCSDARILEHLRGDGPHVRGCWAVDLLLGYA